MTYAELIEGYLKRNYIIKTKKKQYGFDIMDITNEKLYSLEDLGKLLDINFGVERFDVDIKWFENEVSILIIYLNEYIDKLDWKEKSMALVSNAWDNLDLMKNHDVEFIEQYIEKIYIEKNLDSIVNKFLSTKSSDMASIELGAKFIGYMQGERTKVFDIGMDKVNKWYYDNILGPKVMTFMKECILIMGPLNWVVMNRQFGEINMENLQKYFPKEADKQMKTVIGLIGVWYDNERDKESEKLMGFF